MATHIEALDVLINEMKTNAYMEVRAAAAAGLGGIPGDKVRNALLSSMLHDDYKEVRAAAAEALGRCIAAERER